MDSLSNELTKGIFNANGKMIKNNIFNNEDTWTIQI